VPVVRVKSFTIRDTPFFRESADGLRQVIRAEVDGFWEGEGKFILRSAGSEQKIDATRARFRDGRYDLEIAPPTKATAYSCDLVIAGRTIPAREICVAGPHRKWTVYSALKTHYDLGYTHPVDEMLRNAAGPMLKAILGHVEETRSFPETTRFRWVYPTWVLAKLLEMQSAVDRPRLESALRAGDVSWNAAPFTLHSYFCGLEDMLRAFYPSAALERTYGRTVRWAKQTDVPGHTRFLPQALARSGVRLLQIGCNFGVRSSSTGNRPTVARCSPNSRTATAGASMKGASRPSNAIPCIPSIPSSPSTSRGTTSVPETSWNRCGR
jgi:hypothetical protein